MEFLTSHPETEIQSESEQKSQFDAVLVHGHWISRNPDNTFRSSLRTRLVTRAAALAYDGGKIVLTAGHLKGPSYPSTAALMKDELMKKYEIPEEDIIAVPKGYGTGEEVALFLQLARENGWKNVADIGFRTHYRSIRKFLPEGENQKLHVTYTSVEDIINANDNEHVKDLITRLSGSRYEILFKGYELVKDIVMRVPGATDKLYTANKAARILQDDSMINDINAHMIDIFRS